MFGAERGPSPEEMGMTPSEFEMPKDEEIEEIEKNAEDGTQGQNAEGSNKGGSPNPTEEEKESINEVIKEVISGLSMLYDMLPHSGKVDAKRIKKILETIKPLRSMTIPPREAIAGVIVHDDLHTEEKEDFILKIRSIQMVDLWINMQGLSRGADKSIEELRENLKENSDLK